MQKCIKKRRNEFEKRSLKHIKVQTGFLSGRFDDPYGRPRDSVKAVVAQLACARLSEQEVSGSIFSEFNVCFDFPLTRVAIALNTRKTGH